jgi:hypothetical protein
MCQNQTAQIQYLFIQMLSKRDSNTPNIPVFKFQPYPGNHHNIDSLVQNLPICLHILQSYADFTINPMPI